MLEELKMLIEESKSLPEIVLRSLFSVIVLFLLTKMMGKKQISQLTFFDYCVGISIGSIAAEMADDVQSSYIHTITAMIVYSAVSLLFSFISQKSLSARRIITGVPIVLMENGRILYQNLKKSKFDLNEFLEECRHSGYYDLNDIEYAILEASGKISILPKANKKPVTIEDLKLSAPPVGIVTNFIIDGIILEENLKIQGKDRAWLLSQLKQNNLNIAQLSDVLLATYSVNGTLTFYKKDEQQLKKIII